MKFSRHCEERSDEAIQEPVHRPLDCFASLAMTLVRLTPALALLFAVVPTTAQEFSDPYSIMAPERVPARHYAHKSPTRTRPLPPSRVKVESTHHTHRHTVIAHGSPGVVLPTPLPRTPLIPPEGGTAPLLQPAPQQQGVTVLPGVANPIPNLPHGPETFQDRASRCVFQQQLYNVPANLGPQYMGACLQ